MAHDQFPSRSSSPAPRPPSRSERLLRDALIRDDLERHTQPPLPTTPSRRRRSPSTSSGDPYPSDAHSAEQALWYLLRGAFYVPPPPPPNSPSLASTSNPPRLVRNKSSSHIQERRHTSPSPTPGRLRAHRTHRSANTISEIVPSSTGVKPGSPGGTAISMAPHELVSKARLQRVLKGASISNSEQTCDVDPDVDVDSSPPGRNIGDGFRSTSRLPPHLRTRSIEEEEETDWKWRWGLGDTMASPTCSESSSSHSSAISTRHIERAELPTPPNESTLPLPLKHTNANYETLSRNQCPSTHAFDARHAAAMCRQIEGYVSFANVEGLGEPVGLNCDDADDTVETEEEAKKRRFRLRALNLKLGLGWVWPFTGTAGDVNPGPDVRAG